MNLAILLETAADAMGSRVAVGPRDGGMTGAALIDHSRRAAALIQSRAVQRVAMVDVSSNAVPVLLFASALAGVPFAPVNYRLAGDRLRSILERITPAFVVADDAALAPVGPVQGLHVLSAVELLAHAAGTGPRIGEVSESDDNGVAILLFTSGTTGEPKAAVLRHRHLAAYVMSTIEFMGAGEDEAALVSVPPYHIAGVATVVTNLYAGRRIVYLPQFDPREWVRLAEEEAITHAMVVPTMLGRILDALEERGADLPALRHLSYGGGRMPLATIERALDLLPHVGFVNAYGLTETSSTIAVLGPDDHLVAHYNDDPGVKARLTSVGRPLPSLEVEIRDDCGRTLPVGVPGEIYVRGEQVAGEYDGLSALTADGWFPTNDSGRLDADGFLYVEGRLDDVIVRGGENMSPGEIEDVLVQHPAVADAAVTGVADDEWGEAVAAVIVLAPGATTSPSDLQDWVRTHLRSSRVPSRVVFRSQLPYSDTGKLLRRVLKAELTTAS